jgi:hypothetical protein
MLSWILNWRVYQVGTVSGIRITYFWGKVLWCPTECFGGSTICDIFLTQTKVCDLDVSILVQQQILQLPTIQTLLM